MSDGLSTESYDECLDMYDEPYIYDDRCTIRPL